MEETIIQGLSTGEIFFIFILLITSAIWIGLHNRMINASQPEPERELKNHFNLHYRFDYSLDNNIKLFYKDDHIMTATIVDERVHFFWTEDQSEAIPIVENPQHHTMGLERMMKKAVAAKLKPSETASIRTPKDEWDLIKYKALKNRNKAKDHNLEIKAS